MGFGFFIAAFAIPVFDMQLPALFTSSNNLVIICIKCSFNTKRLYFSFGKGKKLF